MITFVNPLEALGLDATTPPDPATVKKARRRLLVEIELSDGPLAVGGGQVERSDLIRALQDLDDERKLHCYHALLQTPRLGAFLTHGDLDLFRSGEPLPNKDAEFVAFISPAFAAQYGKALAGAVREHDAELVVRLTAGSPLLTTADATVADRPVDSLLGNLRQELDSLRDSVKDESLDAEEALTRVRFLVSTETLNALPGRFGPSRSQLARSIRNLAVAAFNNQDAVKPAYTLLSDAARLHSTLDVAEDIRRQLETVKPARDQSLLYERHSDVVARCTALMQSIHELDADAEEGNVDPATASQRACALVAPKEFEAVPDELGEIVAQVAFALRGLSVTLWNEHSEGGGAKAVLRQALLLKLPVETRKRLVENKMALDKAVSDRAAHIESEKADVRKLAQLLGTMMDGIAKHRGDQVNWPFVGKQLAELFSPEVVGWLRYMRPLAPALVHQVLVALAAPMAGLARFHVSGYEAVAQRLKPLTSEAPALGAILSQSAVKDRAERDPRIKRATSGPAVWEQGWFWWIVIIGTFIMLGQCAQ